MCYQKKKGNIVLLLIGILLLNSVMTTNASINEASKIDAVLVLDTSGSMSYSDPDKISIEAIKMFIDMCSEKGDKIGIIAYSDIIVLETGLKEIKSIDTKNELKRIAEKIPRRADTDIGLALKRAVETLERQGDQSHSPIIILLSDGKTDLGKSARTEKQSKMDMKDALEIAEYKGYPIYTIGLNADKTVDERELEQISSKTKAKSFITDTADNLPQILSEIFANHMKLKIVSPGYIRGTGEFEDVKINIPDPNVIEANISILTSNPIELKLYNSDGNEVALPSPNTYYSVSGNYSMVKIINPKQGDWLLKVKGITGDKIKINLIFNYNLGLIMEATPNTDVHKNDVIAVNAHLTSNGNRLDGTEIYKNLIAKLIVTDIDTGDIKEETLSFNGTNFSGNYKIENNHRYELKVQAEGPNFYRISNSVEINVENRQPIISENIGNQKITKGKKKTLDLSKYIVDPDGDSLTYTVASESNEVVAADITGDILTLDGKKVGNTNIFITASDGKSQSINIEFGAKVGTILPYIFIILAIILIIILLFFVLPFIKNANRPLIGQLVIKVIDTDSNKIISTPQYRRLDEYKGKVSLFDVLRLEPLSDYVETEKIFFTRGKYDSVIIRNLSQCIIQNQYSTIDAKKGYTMKQNDEITVILNNVPKSIQINIG